MMQVGTELEVPTKVNPGGACNGMNTYRLVIGLLQCLEDVFLGLTCISSSVFISRMNHSYIHSHPVTGAFLFGLDFGFEKSVLILRPFREIGPGLKVVGQSRSDSG